MKGSIERVAMLGVPGIGKSRNLVLGLWHVVTGRELEGIPQPEAIVSGGRGSLPFHEGPGWVEGSEPVHANMG